MVDRPGIAPGFPACKAGVLLLDDATPRDKVTALDRCCAAPHQHSHLVTSSCVTLHRHTSARQHGAPVCQAGQMRHSLVGVASLPVSSLPAAVCGWPCGGYRLNMLPQHSPRLCCRPVPVATHGRLLDAHGLVAHHNTGMSPGHGPAHLGVSMATGAFAEWRHTEPGEPPMAPRMSCPALVASVSPPRRARPSAEGA